MVLKLKLFHSCLSLSLCPVGISECVCEHAEEVHSVCECVGFGLCLCSLQRPHAGESGTAESTQTDSQQPADISETGWYASIHIVHPSIHPPVHR